MRILAYIWSYDRQLFHLLNKAYNQNKNDKKA